MTQPPNEGAGAGGGAVSIFKRKTGPLANWVWMGILLLAALVYALWKRNRSGANNVEEGPAEEEVPGDQSAPPVFILPQNPQPTVPVNVTVNNPATPPSAPPVGSKPVTPLPSVQPKPSAPAKPSAVAYDTVNVVKYVKGKAAWNSTLWGIAKNKGYGSASKNWTSIWNDPRNAALKKKRGTPEKIQPGDVVYVRRK